MSEEGAPWTASEDLSYFEEAMSRGWIKPTSQVRSVQMCEKILTAAYQVFSKKGYQDTKVSDITTLAGCSVGIFYKRFPDKEHLFYALQYRHYERVHRRIDKLTDVQNSTMATEKVLRGFVRRTIENMVLNAGFNKAQVELSLKDERVLEARRANDKYAANKLMDVLVSRGELPDAAIIRNRLHFAVRAIYATISNLVLFGPGPYPVTDKRVVDNLTQVLIGFLHEEQRQLKDRRSKRTPRRKKKLSN
ncbi:MAG: TetR/AcrR family transcriptional regulator [Pseudomonadales bacterium]